MFLIRIAIIAVTLFGNPSTAFPGELARLPVSIPVSMIQISAEGPISFVAGSENFVADFQAPLDSVVTGLFLQVKARFPAESSILSSSLRPYPTIRKSGTEDAEAILTLPIMELAHGDSTLYLVSPHGEKRELHVRFSIKLRSSVVLASPECEQRAISLDPAPPPHFSWIFLIQCSVEASRMRVALAPLAPVRWSWREGTSPRVSVSQRAISAEIPLADLGKQEVLLPAEFSYEEDGKSQVAKYSLVLNSWRTENQRSWYRYARVSAVGVIQGSLIGWALGAELSWNPTVLLPRHFALVSSIGGTVLNTTSGWRPLGIFGVSANYFGSAVVPELGGGIQTGFGTAMGTSGYATASLAWKFKKRFLKVIERLYIGYSLAFKPFLPDLLNHEIHAGIGFEF